MIVNVELHCSLIVKPKNIILFFFTFSLFAFSHSQFCFSVSHLLSLIELLPFQSSLFLSSHIFLSCSKLALKLGWVRGHGMVIGADFGFWIGMDRWRSEILVDCVWIGELCGSWVRWWDWSCGSSDGFG